MTVERTIVGLLGALALCGCHGLVTRLNPDCHVKQEYQQARQLPALIVPQGLDSPNTQNSLVIPTVEVAPPLPGPKDECLDLPPRYRPAPPSKSGSPG